MVEWFLKKRDLVFSIHNSIPSDANVKGKAQSNVFRHYRTIISKTLMIVCQMLRSCKFPIGDITIEECRNLIAYSKENKLLHFFFVFYHNTVIYQQLKCGKFPLVESHLSDPIQKRLLPRTKFHETLLEIYACNYTNVMQFSFEILSIC